MHTHSVIAQSGQIWKVIIGLLLLIGGAATDMAASFIMRNNDLASLQVLSTAAAAAGFLYLCTRVQCPRCRAKWIWMAVSGKLGPRSLDALISLDQCPKCGYAGQQSGHKVDL